MKSELPPLQIGSPCPKRWDDMTGDSKRRFCDHCQLHVHNLSAMPDDERERFVSESGGRSCIAYELRADGSMITPSRFSWLHRPFRLIRWSAAASLAAFLPFLFSACGTRRTLGAPLPPKDVSSEGKSGGAEPTMLLGTPMLPLPTDLEKE